MDGTFVELIEALMNKPIEELKELYNHREIEKQEVIEKCKTIHKNNSIQ